MGRGQFDELPQRLGFQRDADELLLGTSRKGGPLDHVVYSTPSKPAAENPSSPKQETTTRRPQFSGNVSARGGSSSDSSDSSRDSEMWASEGDIPAEYRNDEKPKMVLSEAVKKNARTAELTDKATLVMGGLEMDALLLDITQAARVDLSGQEKTISGKEMMVLVRCVKDSETGIPTAAEANVLHHTLQDAKLSSEAKQILSRHLRRVGSSIASPHVGSVRKASSSTNVRKQTADPDHEDSDGEKPGEEIEKSSGATTRRGPGRTAGMKRTAREIQKSGTDWLKELEAAVQGKDSQSIRMTLLALNSSSMRCDEAPRPLVLLIRKLRKASDSVVREPARALFEQWREQARLAEDEPEE